MGPFRFKKQVGEFGGAEGSSENVRTVIPESDEGAAARHDASHNCTTGAAA